MAVTQGLNASAPRRPRGPGFLQVGLTVAMAVVLAALTLTARQPPPPAIAEFAPQAIQAIKQSTHEQSSVFGSGEGPGDCPPGSNCGAGTGPGSATTTTSVPATTSTSSPNDVPPASVKHCVGDPPRQIEDPQSPPCIAYWDDSKGNGGSTWTGVTKDTITIAAPSNSAGLYAALVKFFNNRFQLYGRQIRIIETNQTGVAGADAAKQDGAFAALASYADPPYYRELVHNQIVGMYRTPDYTDSDLAANSPYLWGYTMSYSQILANLGDWACHRLVGFPAAHAGPLDNQSMAGTTRKFGIVLKTDSADSTLKPDILKSALQQCGAEVPYTTVSIRGSEANDSNDVSAMKSKGVTTVVCLCFTPNLKQFQSTASGQTYQPEWIVTSYPQLVQADSYDGTQSGRTFGVSFEPMDRVPEDHPQIWAVREADPTNPNASLRTTQINTNDINYRALLALMSGIQMAGPNLTPETFKAGLQRTVFPNPDHPIMAGHVGFQGDYSMTNDAAEFWVTTTSPGPYADRQVNSYTFCWVNHGQRHAPGTWPRGGEAFFQGPCDSGNRSVS
jgi:hypothetical protein